MAQLFAGTLESWVASTPPGFLFAPKAHIRITHLLRLQGASHFTEIFLRALDLLRSAHRLGPILFQLPPQFACDLAVLGEFLAGLPKNLRYALEFRRASWFRDEVYGLLEQCNVALCLAESEKLEAPEVITAGFVYYRLRKPEYRPEDLEAMGATIERLLARGRDAFVYFKHEDTPDGALHAEALLSAR